MQHAIDNYADIGNYLRRARESLSLSVYQVSQSLHIRGKYLQALEDGRLQELPVGKAYVKGYLFQYAKFLGLKESDIEICLARLDMLQKRRPLFRTGVARMESQPGLRLVLATVALAVLVVMVYALTRDNADARYRADQVQPLPPHFQIMITPEAHYTGEPLVYKYRRTCFTKSQRPYPICYHYDKKPVREMASLGNIYVP